MFLLWILMQFSGGVMDFIISVRNVTYKMLHIKCYIYIIGFMFVKAKVLFF